MSRAYKIFRHDLDSPIYPRGQPVWDGSLPYQLPTVKVDRDPARTCSHGWSACEHAHDALRIAGLWPGGRPGRLFVVDSGRRRVVSAGDKLRATSWRIVEEVTNVRPHVLTMSAPFGDLADAITDEQMLWRDALARPQRDPGAVVRHLGEALTMRRLSWTLRRYPDASAASNARAAINAWDAWAAGAASNAWAARVASNAWDAWAAGAAGAAWDARAALAVWYAARRRWTQDDPALLTVGLRDAYRNGLAIAVPIGRGELGWAMVEGGEDG